MGKFVTPLEVKQIEDTGEEGRGSWSVLAPLTYLADSGVSYTVPVGFKTDFASVPRIPIIFDMIGDRANLAATLHDYLYTKQPDGTHPCKDRATADGLLKEAARAQGCSWWIAECLYLGVRMGGASHWT